MFKFGFDKFQIGKEQRTAKYVQNNNFALISIEKYFTHTFMCVERRGGLETIQLGRELLGAVEGTEF